MVHGSTYPFLPFLINRPVPADAGTVNKTGHGIVLANCTSYNMLPFH